MAIEERIPEGTGTIDWSDFLSMDFMAFWLYRIVEIFGDIDMSVIYRRFDRCESFVDACLKLVESDESPSVQFIKQCLEIAPLHKTSGTWNNIAVAFAKFGDCTRALEIAELLEDNVDKVRALSEIYKTLIKINKVEQAESILQKAITITESIQSKNSKEYILSRIATTLVKINKIEQAIDITSSLRGDSHKAQTINKISETIASKDSNQSHLRNILHQHLLHTEYSNVFYQNLILMQGYPSTLNTLSDLRNALLYFPFDQNAASACTHRFIDLLYHDGQIDCAHSIIRAIPDLDLEVLLPDETSITPTYANVAQWLHLVENEDTRDDIKAWVTRVRDGKRDAAWFDTRVKDVALLQSVERTYDNLSAWIDAIEDEDQRDDITSWAERVESGRKDVAWFNTRIKDVFDS